MEAQCSESASRSLQRGVKSHGVGSLHESSMAPESMRSHRRRSTPFHSPPSPDRVGIPFL
jgi:hypothetical protein